MFIRGHSASTANPLGFATGSTGVPPYDFMNKPISEIRYILYARKSSESEDRQALSLDSQEGVLKELAQRYNLALAEILREAHSAKAPNEREVFSQMIRKIKTGKAQGIICWKLDRLARNP